eukprot:ANDGO_05389.mRNA.1 hypothetical protein
MNNRVNAVLDRLINEYGAIAPEVVSAVFEESRYHESRTREILSEMCPEEDSEQRKHSLDEHSLPFDSEERNGIRRDFDDFDDICDWASESDWELLQRLLTDIQLAQDVQDEEHSHVVRQGEQEQQDALLAKILQQAEEDDYLEDSVSFSGHKHKGRSFAPSAWHDPSLRRILGDSLNSSPAPRASASDSPLLMPSRSSALSSSENPVPHPTAASVNTKTNRNTHADRVLSTPIVPSDSSAGKWSALSLEDLLRYRGFLYGQAVDAYRAGTGSAAMENARRGNAITAQIRSMQSQIAQHRMENTLQELAALHRKLENSAQVRTKRKKNCANSREPYVVEVDLHGMLVEPATCVVEGILRRAPEFCESERVVLRVVCGRGSHSRGGRARILPAVLRACQKMGCRFSQHPVLAAVDIPL